MKRELKFRAWDGRMRSWAELQKESRKGDFVALLSMCNQGIPECKLMQFSGLQDSEGVDLYEGDVVYLAGYGMYEVEFPFSELYQAYPEGDIGRLQGNVYVNPELLEVR